MGLAHAARVPGFRSFTSSQDIAMTALL